MSKEVQRQEREREITGADTKKCNINSEMTEQVRIGSAATIMSPTAENEREREKGRKPQCK